MRIVAIATLVSAALPTGSAVATVKPDAALQSLAGESKFAASACYPGTDTPEDREPLTRAVNHAIRDVSLIPRPRDSERVRSVLRRLINDVDLFATRDRDKAYDYAIRIWQASGIKGESGLFPITDQEVLRLTARC